MSKLPPKEPLKPYFPELILGRKTTLKKMELANAKLMFDSVIKDRERLAAFLPWVPFIQSIEDETRFIKGTHEEWSQSQSFHYSFFDSKTGKYLGNLGHHTVSLENHSCEIGYWILGEAEGKGLMKDATEALIRETLKLGFHRIVICCEPANKRSANIPKALGFTYEGCLRDEKLMKEGRYRSTDVYSLLSTDLENIYIQELRT
jgi:ribosomal-protein-serine acetyltransferase